MALISVIKKKGTNLVPFFLSQLTQKKPTSNAHINMFY